MDEREYDKGAGKDTFNADITQKWSIYSASRNWKTLYIDWIWQ